MKWATAAAALRTESFVGLIATVLVVSNAPIFQNIGVSTGCTEKSVMAWYWSERSLVSLFYGSLFASAFFLFCGRVLFDAYCPITIKTFPSAHLYVGQISIHSTNGVMIRDEMIEDWDRENDAGRMKHVVTGVVVLFFTFFSLSFALAIAALARFALN